ncbi:MAG: hypothetical protein MUO63_20815 [Desulfobulbaceae bacterium]|nr:hypothetical protein [Desulfobulbaceae bacterium]
MNSMQLRVKSNNYTVELNVKNLLPRSADSEQFASKLDEILQEVDFCNPGTTIRPLYLLRDGVLLYESETLLPSFDDGNKPRILLVFGNPAVHSVANGMFFFSKTNGDRHQFWGKLANAGLVREYKSEETTPFRRREDEATKHREMLINGTASTHYLVGMTTFFSLPTRSDKGAYGVEELFKDAVGELAQLETQRILSYPFSKDAILVFTQLSTYQHFRTITGTDPLYWPMRNASGEDLKELLETNCDK